MPPKGTCLGLLADRDLHEVAAAVVLGAELAAVVSETTGLDSRMVSRALSGHLRVATQPGNE